LHQIYADPARIDAMTPHLETLETISQDLDEARAKIVATRKSLQAALDFQESDIPEIGQAVARLERMEAELARTEEAIMVREGLR
jgi:tRNA U34 5-carboxymethylaminomethyl modifying GTPase MnmE/TrmE